MTKRAQTKKVAGSPAASGLKAVKTHCDLVLQSFVTDVDVLEIYSRSVPKILQLLADFNEEEIEMYFELPKGRAREVYSDSMTHPGMAFADGVPIKDLSRPKSLIPNKDVVSFKFNKNSTYIIRLSGDKCFGVTNVPYPVDPKKIKCIYQKISRPGFLGKPDLHLESAFYDALELVVFTEARGVDGKLFVMHKGKATNLGTGSIEYL